MTSKITRRAATCTCLSYYSRTEYFWALTPSLLVLGIKNMMARVRLCITAGNKARHPLQIAVLSPELSWCVCDRRGQETDKVQSLCSRGSCRSQDFFLSLLFDRQGFLQRASSVGRIQVWLVDSKVRLKCQLTSFWVGISLISAWSPLRYLARFSV
jgi:hypothetical protein